MKDAVGGETCRGGAKQPLIRQCPNGATHSCASRRNPDVTSGWVSWGTETSYYPEEKKISMIPLVAVSEKGKA